MNRQEKQNEMDVEETEALGAVEYSLMDIDNSNEESEEVENRARSEAKFVFRTSLRSIRQPQLSSTFYVRHLPWQIKLERSSVSKSLSFYLKCDGVPQSLNWSCFAVAELSLLKHWKKPSIYSGSVSDAFTRKIRHIFNAEENQAGFNAFISWEDLCDPRRGFLIDDTIEVQANVKANDPGIEYDAASNVKFQDEDKASSELYYLELPKVSKFRGEHMSSVFHIHQMPFQIMLQTVPKEQPTALGFFLNCNGDPKHPSWSCYVEAELRLVNQEATGEDRTRTLKHLFTREEARLGFRRFISWRNFTDIRKGFIKNDTAHFEIQVRNDASAVSEIQSDKLNYNRTRMEAKIQCAVHNISQLKNTLFASHFYVRNLLWSIKLMQRTCIGPTRQIQKYLSVYLQCNVESDAETWSCYAVAILTLLKDNDEGFSRSLQYLFSKQKYFSGFSHFIPWNHLLDPARGFIKNDSITLMVYIKAEEPHGMN